MIPLQDTTVCLESPNTCACVRFGQRVLLSQANQSAVSCYVQYKLDEMDPSQVGAELVDAPCHRDISKISANNVNKIGSRIWAVYVHFKNYFFLHSEDLRNKLDINISTHHAYVRKQTTQNFGVIESLKLNFEKPETRTPFWIRHGSKYNYLNDYTNVKPTPFPV